MKLVKNISVVLMAIGGINLGLIGAFNFDLIWRISGYSEVVARTLYVLIGIATLLWLLMSLRKSSGMQTGSI
ncbi:MAG: DUF378 domain-containing protein [bacterium]|nr:DUF378 domain-containing protein [bacterium]